ncbi:hypothetical protein [Tropicibacter naphthalenivorans]|uniref:Uncharacterized protein n=1 Tax=Tropicibacter naphthalenivorans TaxID=441103 RepID=A0A0P1GC79_9RHOB|nr:hypothetical protein [Tropicibacter naphthalenivorans]CUH79016.1 hypothetical protein TRN7648_02281 [Tropicibacter naphthalenivorans]SMD03905.1 hypothetical protein SAMN04488093_11193 [Tropicibacter naphthalenivorans]
MKNLMLAALLSASASAAFAGVPPMVLPDLTFPAPTPDVSTQGCAAPQGQTACK